MNSIEEYHDSSTSLLYDTLYLKMWEVIKMMDDTERISITKMSREKSSQIIGKDDGEKPVGLWEMRSYKGETKEQILFIR